MDLLLVACSRCPLQLTSTVFDPTFVRRELKEAENIKDRNNRKAVIRCLKILTSLSYPDINSNGLLIFVGIDDTGEEVLELIEPPSPIREFCYYCSKKFLVDNFRSLFEANVQGSVTFVSGAETLIYRFDGNFHKLKTITANIAKRHKKGGQSSVRFSRLAEESRKGYSEQIVEELNKLETSINWIFGGQELKDSVLASRNLRIELQTSNCYHTFTDQTIRDRYFLQIMKEPDKLRQKQLAEIVSLLETNPDYLIFDPEEIEARKQEIEYLIDARTIEYQSPYYSRLRGFELIGKLYYLSS